MFAIGIDLGTTNSCVAVYREGGTEILENQEGSRTTPSVVASSKDEILVGAVAKRQAATNPDTVTSVKRLIGRRYAETEPASFPFPVENRDGRPVVNLAGEHVTPEEISAKVLMKLKQDAEMKLDGAVNRAVITVPAYFDDAQRQATKDAAKIAGIEVLRMINEPTAAALAYGIKDDEQTVLVFDLGGGTLDVSVLETGEGVFDVMATSGDNNLGGDDFDRALADFFTAEILDSGVDVSEDAGAQKRILEAAEKAKAELSTAPETRVSVPFVGLNGSDPVHLDMTVTRSQMEALTANLLDRLEEPIQKALKDAGEPAIDRVIMVGGMSRMPAVRERVGLVTGKAPSQGVNPDEAVAIGAAVQAGILTGMSEDLLLLDVTPLTLGIETRGGITTPMFPRNTTVPARRSEIFSTAEHDQESVEIHVVQGEMEMAEFNKSLGRFELSGIPPAPLGEPQIEVTFQVDVNGILEVTAKNLETGTENQINVLDSVGMTDEEISELARKQQLHFEEDQRRARLTEARNKAELVIKDAERRLVHMEFLLDSERDLINARGFELRDALKGSDPAEIQRKTEAVNQAFHEASRRIYQEGQELPISEDPRT